ncbi:MAG: XRE family transcriptional regulator [Sphingomonadales bacterium]|nr:MAG: XRE family transcriptional regulator [Sphingomonadales bacterium]
MECFFRGADNGEMITKTTPHRHFIKEWRKHRGLTQEQLASRLEIDRTTISKIESGKQEYSQGFLEAAAYALRCDPADLIMRDPTTPSAVWSIWDAIPDSDKPRAIAILSTFADLSKKAG